MERLIERKIAATDTQWAAWKLEAVLAGVSLRQWIRDKLDAS